MSTDGLILCIAGVVMLCLAPILARIEHDWFTHSPFRWLRIIPDPQDSSPLIIAYGCMGLVLLLVGVAMSLPVDVAKAVAPYLGVCVLPLVAGAAASAFLWRLGGVGGPRDDDRGPF